MTSLPLVTADLPGIGGRLKTEPEDFLVEELPAYPPCGEGDHLFLWIEKRDLSGEQLLDGIAQRLRIGRGEVGMAGLKDRRAVTRQWVSVPARCEPKIGTLDGEAVKVLESKRHRNKLKTGHLVGNRFDLLLRDVSENAIERAEPIAERLRTSGCSNAFGDQRFGRDGDTLRIGLDLLNGKITPADLPRKRRKFLLRLSLSASQSWLFNSVLTERITAGDHTRIFAGDVMQVRESGGLFLCDDPDTDTERFARREIVPTGPLFGPKMKEPTGPIAEREAKILAESELTAESFRLYRKVTPGGRRPLLIWPENLTVEPHPSGLRFRFDLPSGVYATTVLREFQEPLPEEESPTDTDEAREQIDVRLL